MDGQSYVLVPEHEHSSPPADKEKVDAMCEKLRGVRNELFEDGGLGFNLVGKQLGIAIDLLKEGLAGGDEEGDEEEGGNEEKEG